LLKRSPLPHTTHAHAGTAYSHRRHDPGKRDSSAYTFRPAKLPIELEGGASGSGRQTARVRRQDDTCNPSLPTFPLSLPSLSPFSCLFWPFLSLLPLLLPLFSSYPTNANTPSEWTPSDGSSTATGRARAGPTASTRGRCGRLGIRTEQRPVARAAAASARSTSHQEGVEAARADLYLARLGEHVRDDHVPDGTHGDTLKAELLGGQATRRMYAHSGEDDDVHAGRGDIRDNGRAQQRTRARPPRTATLRERRLPHRARYTAPLSVQVRPAALSACRANG
ncbi:hypothetical protein K438DRAFT_1796667, partial [Mycena galopus ATCC 62051]